ncbi:hypothetical protein BDN72DRAFT_753845 [Pluteus cervinus]|uniref:Uncharacterized protein n=1 Tax=Pluteus cervinus TaxID=181527 RepID=A0ACD3BHI1_9AGAR|nr:hypothetical protein BDN72DRAFT_753845 [Pluteus cervinus]
MLVLSTLYSLLSQVLSQPGLHTAVLLTPTGQLVSVASEPSRPKDEIRVLVGLAGEVWQETKGDGVGMVESEMGRIVVLPVDEDDGTGLGSPLMLLALNSTDAVSWEESQKRGRLLAGHLAKSLTKYRDFLALPRAMPTASPTLATLVR